ncbi:SagB/ThcOx family dehydrogenase [Methanofollis tationis]|uniref:SagB/ThcOx family dehydrogenase n=1 Tax=Methanofollis tationis TaxID=81417 RepID=A0A7K4HLP6_9EURY|nr:SagB/ThcOx family dehydrogenase [Methanofollis tationis]NVO65850.1 SagB/ThcOx family dehydrogenase [Methanofollis tationis]
MGTGQEFIEKTRFPYLGPSDQRLGRAQPPLERKDSGAGLPLPLPGEACPGAIDLTAAIARRRSVRTYATAKMPLATLSYLLWCSQGVQSVVGQDWTIRSVPSAGARHALETYVLANRVDGVEPGLYHYAALSNRLFRLQAPADVADRIRDACLNQPMVTDAAAFFIWAADIYRMTWRYGERGYRYIFIDAGHACQNLYLAAEAVDCGVCAIGAFDDDALNAILGLDGKDIFVIYCAAAGMRAGAED